MRRAQAATGRVAAMLFWGKALQPFLRGVTSAAGFAAEAPGALIWERSAYTISGFDGTGVLYI